MVAHHQRCLSTSSGGCSHTRPLVGKSPSTPSRFSKVVQHHTISASGLLSHQPTKKSKSSQTESSLQSAVWRLKPAGNTKQLFPPLRPSDKLKQRLIGRTSKRKLLNLKLLTSMRKLLPWGIN